MYIHLEETDLAKKIIKIYVPGKSKGKIDEETTLLETHATFRVVRGLSELMRRKTVFEPVYAIPPKTVRTYVYEKGYVTTEEERHAVLVEACQEFGVSLEDIESAFWADREEYQLVASVTAITPVELIKLYNLSLTQTLLFDALSLEFITSGNYQEIFRMIKYLGLMYEVESAESESESTDSLITRVTGPASLFKKTKKYGTSLAKLLPRIMKAPSWKIKAKIETTIGGEPRIYIFELSDTKKGFFPDVIPEQPEQFDSAVEEDFVKRFSSLRKDWEIKREPTILKTGPSVMIPDFSLERRGKTCYIEIIGFWTPEYLEKKIEKVKMLNEEITLCVNKELQCTKKDFQKENVDIIFYDKKVSMKPILEKIRKIESEQLQKEQEELSKSTLELHQEVTSLTDIAQMYNVGVETVKTVLETSKTGAVIGDAFVKYTVLQKIQKELETLEDMHFTTVKKVLDTYGLNETVLKKVGYEIEWKTLDIKNALVRKIADNE